MAALAKSVVYARGQALPAAIDTPEKAFAVALAGWELGVKPMTAFRHVFTVNGRTEPDAQLMMGMVRAKDPRARFTFKQADATACTVTLERPGQEAITVTYTLADAQASGQAAKGGPWKSYTRDMLAWAAVKRVCRLGAPDVINNIAGVPVSEAATMMALAPGPEEDFDFGQVAPAVPAPQPEPAKAAPDELLQALREQSRRLSNEEQRALRERIVAEFPHAEKSGRFAFANLAPDEITTVLGWLAESAEPEAEEPPQGFER